MKIKSFWGTTPHSTHQSCCPKILIDIGPQSMQHNWASRKLQMLYGQYDPPMKIWARYTLRVIGFISIRIFSAISELKVNIPSPLDIFLKYTQLGFLGAHYRNLLSFWFIYHLWVRLIMILFLSILQNIFFWVEGSIY